MQRAHLTLNQQVLQYALQNRKKSIVFAVGPAGTGKTSICCSEGVSNLLSQRVERLVLTRPAKGLEESHGYLPGTLDQKMQPWLLPIIDAMGHERFHNLKRRGDIEICPLSHIRGRTFKNAWIIADEMQNCSPLQMKTILTRIGQGSKLTLTGDPFQCDIQDSGLTDFITRTQNKQMKHVEMCFLTNEDIKRHEAVHEVLRIYET